MTRGGGYTIIETMIFLAVTTALFVTAINLIGGRQAGVEFDQAVQSARSKIQDIINQVSIGYYPNTGSFTCVASASGRPTFNLIQREQGASNDCVFIGKAIKFSTGATASEYNVFSLAARRFDSPTSGKEVGNLNEAQITPIASFSSGDNRPDVTENLNFEFGLSVTRVVVPGGAQYGTILFLSTLPKFQASTGVVVSGSQRISYAALTGSALTDDVYAAASGINTVIDGSVVVNPPSGIVVCLADNPVVGSATKKAMLTIGKGTAQASVKLDTGFYDTPLCES